MDPGTALRVLGLERGAGQRDIKDAYRRLAREWHPDLYPYGPELKKRCEEKMSRINTAYDALRERGSGETDGPIPEEPAAEAEREPEPQAEEYYQEDPEPEPEYESEISTWTQTPRPGSNRRFEWPWEAPKDKPDYPGLMRVGLAFALTAFAMAFIYASDSHYAAYFLMLRTLCTLALAYGVVFSLGRGYWDVGLGLGMLAIVMNPLLPSLMSVFEWKAFAFVYPLTLFWAWMLMSSRESKLR